VFLKHKRTVNRMVPWNRHDERGLVFLKHKACERA